MISLGNGKYECRQCGKAFSCGHDGNVPTSMILARGDGTKERLISADGKEVHRCSKPDPGSA